jgi:hypothetical protein
MDYEVIMNHEKTVLAPDEAAVLAVFDPLDGRNLAELLAISDRAIELSGIEPLDERLAAILMRGESRVSREGPWTRKPRYADGVLVLRLRQLRQGSVAPWVRKTAMAGGLAVLDLLTYRVFAAPEIQPRFEVPEWSGHPRLPPGNDWMQAGSFVTHSTFGSGRVLDIGKYKGRRVLVVLFADRERVLDLEYGLPQVRATPPPSR